MQSLARSEALARWAVFLLFALLPFFFVPVPWVSVAQAKIILSTVLAVVALLAWIAASLKGSQLRVARSPLLIAAALIPIAYLVSALAAGATWESFVGQETSQDTVMGSIVWYILLFVSAAVLSSGYGRASQALRLLLSGCSIALLVQVVHLAFPSFTFGGALPIASSSIVGSWHDLGIFLGLMTFISVALVGTRVAEGRWRYVAVLNACVATALLVIANYPDVWVGLFLLCIFYVLFLYKTRAPGSGILQLRGMKVWLLFAALAIALYFGGSTLYAVLPARLQVEQVEVRPSWRGTFDIGHKVFAEPSRAFFGSGPSTFSREWGLYKPLSINTTQFWNVDFYHGIGFIPTSIVTMGIVGLLAWGAVCASLLWSLWRWFRVVSADSVVHTIIVGSAVYLTAFHLLYVPGPLISFLTFLVFGALVAQGLHAGIVREWVVPLSWGSWIGRGAAGAVTLLGLLVLFAGVQSSRAILSDLFVNRAVTEYNRTQDPKAASRSIALAVTVLPNNDRAHRAGVELGLLQLSKMISDGANSEEARAQLQATLNSTIQHGLAAVSIESRNYQNWLTLARLYGELAGVGVEGAETSARDAYAKVLENNPTNPLPYLGLAQLDIAGGKEAEARKNLESAIQIKPDLASAHFLLSQIHARANEMAKAEEHAIAVVQLAADDPLGWYNLGTVFYAQENNENAALALERAVTLQNNYANALFLLGLSYYKLDRRNDALSAFKLVAELSPGDASLAGMISKLEGGQDLDLLSQ